MHGNNVIQFSQEARKRRGGMPLLPKPPIDLDNSRINEADMSEGANDMSKSNKKFRQRAQIGDQTVWLCGDTRQELLDQYLQLSIKAGIVVTPGQAASSPASKAPTVRTFIENTYFPTFVARLAPKTVENYRQYISLNILPFMGDMRMDEVSVATIQQFYDWMATAGERGRKKNLNAKSIERIAGLTGRIFKVAVEMKIIEESPFKHSLLRIHAEQAGHHKAMADAQIAHVRCAIPALKNPDERLYMGLLAYTGMRPEEVLGLRWEDVALDAQYATVVRAVTYPGNSKPHVGKPKTSYSARTVVLPGILVDLLRPLQKTSGFILGGEQPWCYSRKHRVSKAAFAHLGLKGYSDADFRTTFGTQMKEMGKTSAEVADMMGHADTRMVERVYARTRHEGVMKHLSAVEEISGKKAAV